MIKPSLLGLKNRFHKGLRKLSKLLRRKDMIERSAELKVTEVSRNSMQTLVMERFRYIFPRGIKTVAISKQDPRLLGVGGKILVFRAGQFDDHKTGERKWFALKACRYPDNWVRRQLSELEGKMNLGIIGVGELPDNVPAAIRKRYFDENYFVSHRHGTIWLHLENENFKILRNMGIPTIESYKLVKTNPEQVMTCAVLPVEDLSEGGTKQVLDYYATRRKNIPNYEELRKQFKEYRDKILKAKAELSNLAKESATPNLCAEIAKCFFVVIDPKTGNGRLVAGTASSIQFPKKAYFT
ncbi:MAG: hypothetical protein AABW72_01855 [archaeon]